MSKAKFVVLTLAVCFLLAGAVSADTYIKQATHTDAVSVMGQNQPERFDTSEVWLGDGVIAVDASSGIRTILKGDESSIYMVNMDKKTYSVTPFNLGTLMEDVEVDEEFKAQVNPAMAMMGNMEMTVTPTEETRKIRDWDCKKYEVVINLAMMKVSIDMWATDEIDVDWDSYRLATSAMFAMFPNADKAMAEFKKVEGMTVESTTTLDMMGTPMNSTTSLIEYAEKDAPEGMFDIPSDFKKLDAMEMMGGPGGN